MRAIIKLFGVLLIVVSGWSAALAELDFALDGDGRLQILRDGKVIMGSESLMLFNAQWRGESAPLAVKPVIVSEDGGRRVSCSWATDVSEVKRTVEKLPDGEIRIGWQVKFLNGIVEGRHCELTYNISRELFAADLPTPPGRTLLTSNNGFEVRLGERELEYKFAGYGGEWHREDQPWSLQDMRGDSWHGHFRLIMAWPYDPQFVNQLETSMTLKEGNF